MSDKTDKIPQGVQPQRKITRSEKWFNANVTDNPREIAEVCNMTARSIHDQLNIRLRNPNSTNALFAVVFDRTFTSIANYLAKMQAAGYRRYTIIFGSNFNVGYQDDPNEDNEKIGNFIPILEYGNQNKSIVPYSSQDSDEAVITSCKRWLELNIKKCIEETSSIASETFDRLLNEDNINLRYKEAVIPIFCTFVDMLVEVMKFKYQERKEADSSQIEINVFDLFWAYYWFDDKEKTEVIEFEPGIKLKQDMKSDKFAGGSDK